MIDLKLIKLAFFDIDGTLVNAAGEISKPVLGAVQKLKERGVILALASGRPLFSAKWIIDEIGIDGPSLLGAGSIIINPSNSSVLFEWELEKKRAQQLLDEALQVGLHVELYTADQYFVSKMNSYSEIHKFYLKHNPQEANLSDVLSEKKVNRILLMAVTTHEKDKVREIQEKYSEFSWGIGKGATHPDIIFANATHPNGTREWGFDYITNLLKISSKEVISFGDSDSDITFLKKAGIGVAMGNASAEVKSIADIVCESVEDNGIALFLDNNI